MVNTSSSDKNDAVSAAMYLILERINYYYYSHSHFRYKYKYKTNTNTNTNANTNGNTNTNTSASRDAILRWVLRLCACAEAPFPPSTGPTSAPVSSDSQHCAAA